MDGFAENVLALLVGQAEPLPRVLHERLSRHPAIDIRVRWAERDDLPADLVTERLRRDPNQTLVRALVHNPSVDVTVIDAACGRGQRGKAAAFGCALRDDHPDGERILAAHLNSKRAGWALHTALQRRSYDRIAGNDDLDTIPRRLAGPTLAGLPAELVPWWVNLVIVDDETTVDETVVAAAVHRAALVIDEGGLARMLEAVPPLPAIVAAVTDAVDQRPANTDRSPFSRKAGRTIDDEIAEIVATWSIPVTRPVAGDGTTDTFDPHYATSMIARRDRADWLLAYAAAPFDEGRDFVARAVLKKPNVTAEAFIATIIDARPEQLSGLTYVDGYGDADLVAKFAHVAQALTDRGLRQEAGAWDRLSNQELRGTPCDGVPLLASIAGTPAEGVIGALLARDSTLSLAEMFATAADILDDPTIPDASCPCGTRCNRASIHEEPF